MQAAVMARQAADQAVTSTHKELCLYLKAPLEQVDDIMAWWGVCAYIALLRFCHLLLLILALATLHSVPDPCSHCKGLSCGSRVFCTL